LNLTGVKVLSFSNLNNIQFVLPNLCTNSREHESHHTCYCAF